MRLRFLLPLFALFACETPDTGAADLDSAGEVADSRDVGELATGVHSRVMCTGSACTGLWPDDTYCTDAKMTAATKDRDNITIDLKYSTSCGTNWAYTERNDGKAGYIWEALEIDDNLDGKADKNPSDTDPSDGDTYFYTREKSTESSLKTKMYYCPTGYCLARACGKGTSTAEIKCTAWK